MIKAGELREKVMFQRQESIKKDSGGSNFDYTTYLNTFAKVVEETSKGDVSDNRVSISNTLKLIIRFRPGVNIQNGDKVLWRGLEFIVDNLKVDPLRTSIEMNINSHVETSKRTSL